MSIDENEHAFARAREWHASMKGRGVIRSVDDEAFLYHLALLIKRERVNAVEPINITGETKGKDPREHGGDDDCG